MTRGDRFHRDPLPPCKCCGMCSGLRMMTDTEPQEFFVICEVCSYKTRKHPTQNAATREWSRRNG